MNVRPDEASTRREALERWMEEQRRSTQPAGRRPSRTGWRLMQARHRLAARCQWLADHVFDRGLETAGVTTEPEHDHPDRVHYVPSDWHVLPRALHYLGVSDRDK